MRRADNQGMRTIRQFVPGVVYHLIWRFVDRSWFFTADAERERYLTLFAHALKGADWRCLAYALMSNHIHLAMLAGRMALCDWSRRVNSPFADWINQQHRGLGPVFAHRAADYAILPAKVGPLISYIHNNPVRAGLVAHARDTSWTSHRSYVGLTSTPSWLCVEDGLALSGVSRAAFDAYVNGEPGESGIVEVDRVGRAIRRRGALEVATASTAAIPIVGRAFAHVRVDARQLVELAAETARIPMTMLCSRRRGPAILVARRAAIHAGQVLGLTVTDLAAALGLSITAVSGIARRALSVSETELHAAVLARVELSAG